VWQAVRVILTRRLLLRRPIDADAHGVLDMLADEEVRRWNPDLTVDDPAGALDWCRRMADWSDGDHATWSVIDPDTDAFLGSVSVHSINPIQADAEIGYRVVPRARGNRVGTEAVSAATAWAFDNLSLIRIELAHAVANPASCAVARRAGYQLEGLLRQSFVYGDGRRYDEHLHARLLTDLA
jgi:RimJ/RimL family protein N-acetyltransferase